MRILKTAVAALVAAAWMTGSASAVTITNADPFKTVDITCTGSCEFWYLGTDPDGFSATDGSWLSGSYGGIGVDNSNADRLLFVNNVLGTDFLKQSETTDGDLMGVPIMDAVFDAIEKEFTSFTTSAKYLLAWGGTDPRYILIANYTVGNTFTWDAGQRSGLSGVDGFGVIPLPAAGWLLLAGVGGLAAMRRRKKAA